MGGKKGSLYVSRSGEPANSTRWMGVGQRACVGVVPRVALLAGIGAKGILGGASMAAIPPLKCSVKRPG